MHATGRQSFAGRAAPDGAPLHYERHRPEQATLYRLVQQHAASFIAHTEASTGAERPRFIKDEFDMGIETPDTVRRISAFIQALGLDEINISRFSPLHGAPIWDECISGESGQLHEDWRLMNCMNFVFQPSGFGSREEMDEHYNAAVKGFYTGKTYQRRFARRLWQHRFSLLHLARSLPTLLQAKRYYDSDRHSEGVGLRGFPLHPRQPLALPPLFSPGLLVGKKNAAAREAIVIRQAA